MEDILSERIHWRDFVPSIIVVVNSLTWNVFMLLIFSTIVNSLPVSSTYVLALFAIEYTSVAVSAVIGSIFFPFYRRITIFVWMLSGAFLPAAFFTMQNNDLWVNALISSFFGACLGAGLPSALACFADSAVIEKRGFLGGIIYLFVGLSTAFFVAAIAFLGDGIIVPGMIFWRLSGAFLFLFTYKYKEKNGLIPSYSLILRQRNFMLYFLPWIMFCIVNWIEAPILQNLFGELYSIIGFTEVIISGVFAFLGGIISDNAGRKRVIMMGFVTLGIGYAMLSLFSEISFFWYMYAVLDGVAWGMFASVFFMVLWGDISGNYQKEKYYTLGGLPYLVAMFLSELIKPYVESMPLVTTFSLASFFLFLAVVPLMYAPETLPEKTRMARELRSYIEKAKRVREKFTKSQ